MAPNWGAYWYNALTLRIYDAWVLGFNMGTVWGCRTAEVLLPLFCNNFSRRHLDIGVATGYFPSAALSHLQSISSSTPFISSDSDRTPPQEITLMDLNTSSLKTAKGRIEADHPWRRRQAVRIDLVQGDVLGPIPEALPDGKKFDSISMFNLLHCIPGPPERKTAAFGLAAQILAEDGILFGNTVLGWRYMGWWNPLAWLTMIAFNLVGAFGNWEDSVEVFEAGLRREFEEVETEVVGQMLLFRARRPRRDRQH
ncbi:hypothetical protein B0H63DRAFT_488635 [Podospora didyma]|uniref:Methyltransferase n=1 Tax=Podospora didyma TaxID=330526 RepID=A0AAE0K1V6_9PEZI|nr:hypothetical protein B0H63DRAFT_488635 [Podospora didyma]